MPLNIAVLASGRGSNLKAILEAIKSGSLDARVTVVICNVQGAGAISIANEHGITTEVIPHLGLARQKHESMLLEALDKYPVDFVVLAGYMRVLSPYFLNRFRDDRGFFRVLNIHPSLLPAFPGANAYKEAFDYGVRISGITIHLVDEKVDHGPILAQETFPRLPEDSLDSFKARGLSLEHKLLPQVIQKISHEGVTFFARVEATGADSKTVKETVSP